MTAIEESDSTHYPSMYAISSTYPATSKKILRLAEKAYQSDTLNKYYLENLGAIQGKMGNYNDAIKSYSRLTKLDSNPYYYQILVSLYSSQKQPQKAIEVVDSAIVRYGKSMEFQKLKFDLLLQTRQFDRAELLAQSLVDEFPYDSSNHADLGRIYEIKRQNAKALEEYKKSVEIDPSNIVGWLAIASYYSTNNIYNNEFFDAALRVISNPRVKPEWKKEMIKNCTSNIQVYRANYYQIGNLTATLAIMYPDDKEAARAYTDHLLRGGEYDEALKIFRDKINRDNVEEDAYSDVIFLENYLKKYSEALKHCEEAIEKFPSSSSLYFARGNILSSMEDYTGAISSYLEMIKKFKDKETLSNCYLSMADAYHLLENNKECYRAMEKALKYNPNNSYALNNYAYFLSLENTKLDKALQMSILSNKLDSNNPSNLDTLGWIYYLRGEYELAKKYIQQAIANDKHNSAELYLHYGDVMEAMNNPFMAKTYWKKALEKGYKDAVAIEQRINRIER